jgi:ACT domain
VGQLIRLRISLADRAGALAQATTIIGLHGGNIVSVDVQRTRGDTAVDELIVEFSTEPEFGDLADDLFTHASVRLLSQHPARFTDPIEAVLLQIAEQLDTGHIRPSEALAAEVAALCSAPVVWVTTKDEASRYDAGRAALDRNEPVSLRGPRLPDELGGRLSGEVNILAVPDASRLDDGHVVFAARHSQADFTDTEISRIQALIALHARIERLLDASARPAP